MTDKKIVDYRGMSLEQLNNYASTRGLQHCWTIQESVIMHLTKDVEDLSAEVTKLKTKDSGEKKVTSLTYIKARIAGAAFPVAATVRKGSIDISSLRPGEEEKLNSRLTDIVINHHYITYIRSPEPSRGAVSYVKYEGYPTLLWLVENADEAMINKALAGLGITNMNASIRAKIDLLYIFSVTNVQMIFDKSDVSYISSLGLSTLDSLLTEKYMGPRVHSAMLFTILTGYSISPHLENPMYKDIEYKDYKVVVFLATHLYRCLDGPDISPPHILQCYSKHPMADSLEIYYCCSVPISDLASACGITFPKNITDMTDCSNERIHASNMYYITNILEYKSYITRSGKTPPPPPPYSRMLTYEILAPYSDIELLKSYPGIDIWESRRDLLNQIIQKYSIAWYQKPGESEYLYHGPLSVITEGTPMIPKRYRVRGLALSFETGFFVSNHKESNGIFPQHIISDLRDYLLSISPYARTFHQSSLLSVIEWLREDIKLRHDSEDIYESEILAKIRDIMSRDKSFVSEQVGELIEACEKELYGSDDEDDVIPSPSSTISSTTSGTSRAKESIVTKLLE